MIALQSRIVSTDWNGCIDPANIKKDTSTRCSQVGGWQRPVLDAQKRP